MLEVNEGDLLWEPSAETIANANLTHYMRWLASQYDLHFASYRALWRWSVTDISRFWQSMWEYFDVNASRQPSSTLINHGMPGTSWFPDARLNYAENLLAKMIGDAPAIYYKAEDQPLLTYTRQDIVRRVRDLAQVLRALGVERGDRVVAYMPNLPETFIGLLATASLGAIWSSCSPDFGRQSVLDRFSQIEPKVLLAVSGYQYNGQYHDRLHVVQSLQANLPTLQKTILLPHTGNGTAESSLPDTLMWAETLSNADPDHPLTYEQVPFDHPLWILYSSGTTGLPKPIVHGHGGILLEHLKELSLHMDLKAADRFFWYTNTGWMMWNYLVDGLLCGCPIVLYNGSPGYPDLYALWHLAEEAQVTYFGASAAFLHACLKEEIRPAAKYDLGRIRALGSTGSPLSPAGFQWVYENVNADLALESFSGGTDLCTGFVGGIRLQPIYAGEIQGASLGANVQAFNRAGEAVTNEVGEMVITEPMPSMPVCFWNDPDNKRYQASYFSVFPGVWRHGDWIKFNERGGCVIYGRSDATINRRGIRMGTSEIYRVVESFPEISDSLVIDLEALGRDSYMPLFVVLRDGVVLDDDLKQRVKQRLREELSPHHVPDDIFAIAEIPYTLSGKKMEIPMRRILLGQEVERTANPGAMRNPAAVDFFLKLRERL